MNELKRMEYLDALGIDSYVSRRQLPGAAVTQRLAIRPTYRAPVSSPGSTPEEQVGAKQPAAVPAQAGSTVARPVSALVEPRARVSVEPAPAPSVQTGKYATDMPRFNLVTIVAGDWLWLEELGGMPLTTAQLQLVQSMARALHIERARLDAGAVAAGPDTAKPDVLQFDWPIHTNRQLDQGEAAARAGVAGFLARRLEQKASRGLVLLGQVGAARVPVQELGVATVCTASSAEMLANPALKRQAWRDLLPLIRQS